MNNEIHGYLRSQITQNHLRSVYKHIEIVPYNSEWPTKFEAEALLIREALGQYCLAIHHIGSTSVPGLCAKDILDILCVVDGLPASLLLQNSGYTAKGEYNIPLRSYFSRSTSDGKVNLHVVEPDHGFIPINLTFREYLRAHDDARIAYAQLKERLLQDPESYQRLEKSFTGYNLGRMNSLRISSIKLVSKI